MPGRNAHLILSWIVSGVVLLALAAFLVSLAPPKRRETANARRPAGFGTNWRCEPLPSVKGAVMCDRTDIPAGEPEPPRAQPMRP